MQVCTREERQLMQSGSREGKQLEQQLLARQVRGHGSQNASGTDDSTSLVSLNDIAQAVAFKDRLIEFDRTRFVDLFLQVAR